MTMRTQPLMSALALGLLVGACSGRDVASDGEITGGKYPGDLTGGKHLVIYVAGLANPSTGFFRVLNNGAQEAGSDLGVEVRYVYPASVDLASYTQKIGDGPWTTRPRPCRVASDRRSPLLGRSTMDRAA